MLETRRDVLKLIGLLGALVTTGLTSRKAAAQQRWNKAAFDTKNLADTVKALGGGAVSQSRDIVINAPDVEENGARVEIGITSRLPNTQAIYLLVDKNPNWLAAAFTIPAGTEPVFTTRIKMNQSANVLALVRANNQFYMASREVRVVMGGCVS